MDAAINCNIVLINADKTVPEYDFVGLHRSKDPGVGAFTPYHGMKTVILEDVPAGGELFKYYGDEWFTSREEYFGKLPLSEDYPLAEKMIKTLHRILEQGKVPEAARRDLWELMLHWPWEKTRTLNAIPSAYESLDIVAKQGIRAAYQPQATRTLEELERAGRCTDNIRPMPSTIRQAGRGAFATRFLPKGKIVAGTPFLFFASGDFFKMYAGDWLTKDFDEFDPETLKSYQLVYNYCWHHEKNVSSVYLCPYGSGVNYINHNQTRANVRLQWAEDGQMNHNASMLERSPAAMYYNAAPKLWMDIVATCDIQQGEELLMDYGDAWEKAWLEHVDRWKTETDYPAGYVSAYGWNSKHPHAMLRTEEEQEIDPYPEHFQLVCLAEINEKAKIRDSLTSEVAEKMWAPDVDGLTCQIVEREEQDDGVYWYRVRYLVPEDPAALSIDTSEETWMESDWIVREAMRFLDAPYSNDLFLDEAFRHPVGFPDDIFPDAWKGVFLPPLPDHKNLKVIWKRNKAELNQWLNYW
jgi:SET domain